MKTVNDLIGLGAGILSLSSLILTWLLGRRQLVPLTIWREIKRATLSGLGFLIFVVSGATALYYLGYFGTSSNEKGWNLGSLGALFCFSFPIGFIVVIGSFFWYRQQESTQNYLSDRLDKLVQKSKKSR
jgi:hypothetical protein